MSPLPLANRANRTGFAKQPLTLFRHVQGVEQLFEFVIGNVALVSAGRAQLNGIAASPSGQCQLIQPLNQFLRRRRRRFTLTHLFEHGIHVVQGFQTTSISSEVTLRLWLAQGVRIRFPPSDSSLPKASNCKKPCSAFDRVKTTKDRI